MAYNLKLTEEAKDDFRGMFQYYLEATQDIATTENIIQDIRGKIEHLKVFPFRCPALNPDDQAFRALYYKRYAILYEVQEDTVVILNVKHTSILQ